ncbi:phosphomannose isomerase type II C-terminal cupin domain [Calothrix sp. FACHB-1219]|uniref:phosphomannose isomerase type II C-terminal cupin domain n=1 Tax=unclassified Calothrix TaxID=2619626 RepID=UPI0016863DA3|nr:MULTISPECIES: phosphomannose isomerase type II C-terminal cupin domain [unclassified Calothrix]MBD2204675.1 phosphomannose isomerase type II C-terminal cupin domain [Calothrix sp. FACHB-168]MBD2216813.1 phosphomannose isomerase type II C-terminal cupin domain [Calothrix sp. FACHB-1219]
MTDQERDNQSNSSQSSHSGARYWGNVEVVEEGDNYRISRVEIKPRHSIKPQIHYHRNEHWVVVSGVAKITCGQQEIFLNRNESTYVPAATLHKVENPGSIPLVILEIQNGEYLGEDDIERPYDLNLVKPVNEI